MQHTALSSTRTQLTQEVLMLQRVLASQVPIITAIVLAACTQAGGPGTAALDAEVFSASSTGSLILDGEYCHEINQIVIIRDWVRATENGDYSTNIELQNFGPHEQECEVTFKLGDLDENKKVINVLTSATIPLALSSGRSMVFSKTVRGDLVKGKLAETAKATMRCLQDDGAFGPWFAMEAPEGAHPYSPASAPIATTYKKCNASESASTPAPTPTPTPASTPAPTKSAGAPLTWNFSEIKAKLPTTTPTLGSTCDSQNRCTSADALELTLKISNISKQDYNQCSFTIIYDKPGSTLKETFPASESSSSQGEILSGKTYEYPLALPNHYRNNSNLLDGIVITAQCAEDKGVIEKR